MENTLMLLAAGTLAGAMNALAGGGSFVILPALILAGVPSTVANATSTVALFPGALASAWTLRRDFSPFSGVATSRLLAVSLAGGLIGNQLAMQLTCQDQSYLGQSTERSLSSGQPVSWRNPDTGNYGEVTPVRTYNSQSGQYCREFQQTIYVGGKQENGYGTACRQPDGSWRIVGS